MQRLSSSMTFFYKRVLPAIWLGMVGVSVIGLAIAGASDSALWAAMISPIVMGVIGFVVMKKLLWILVDEVHDGGDHLVVRNKGAEERIELGDVMNVSSTRMNPPRITLRIARQTAHGAEVTFLPRYHFTLNPFATHPIAEDLIVRVDAARRGVTA